MSRRVGDGYWNMDADSAQVFGRDRSERAARW